MPTYCSAFGCTNSSGKESCRKKGVSFHKFPLTNKILLYRWLVNVKRANFKPTDYSYICSDHFNDEDFEYQPFTKRRGLKKGAVPSRFSFDSPIRIRQKKGNSHKKKHLEMFKEDSVSESVFSGIGMNANDIQEVNPALVDIVMNEKFYLPEQLKALTDCLPDSSKLQQKSRPNSEERIVGLKESLRAKIILRSLKKQLLDAEIKAANARRDYYEAKSAMLLQIKNDSDSEDNSESEADLPVQEVKTKLQEEKLSAQIEERMLQEQLEDAKMQAANYEMEYYAAKSSMLYSS